MNAREEGREGKVADMSDCRKGRRLKGGLYRREGEERSWMNVREAIKVTWFHRTSVGVLW
jgi:hypothetical protein